MNPAAYRHIAHPHSECIHTAAKKKKLSFKIPWVVEFLFFFQSLLAKKFFFWEGGGRQEECQESEKILGMTGKGPGTKLFEGGGEGEACRLAPKPSDSPGNL